MALVVTMNTAPVPVTFGVFELPVPIVYQHATITHLPDGTSYLSGFTSSDMMPAGEEVACQMRVHTKAARKATGVEPADI